MRLQPSTEPNADSNPNGASELLGDGRYLVRGVLGVGAQGETLAAWDRLEAKEVAIKRFRVHSAKSWKDVELAEREARVLATLGHPRLPRYFEHFEADGCLYLVMQKIDGESLAARCARGVGLTSERAWQLLDEIAEVLEYLHSRNPPVVHRDIKPGNVIARPDGSCALVDFGSVQHGLRPRGGSTVAGTFGFMAPEQLYGVAGPATDIYAVGATLLCVLSGLEPEQWVRRGLTIDVRGGLGRGTDPRLVRLLEAMLEPNPDTRPSDLRALLALHRAKRARRSRRWVLLAAGATCVLASTTTRFWYYPLRAQFNRATKPTDWQALPREHWQRADYAAASRALTVLEGTDRQVTSASAIGAHLFAADFERAAATARRLVPTVKVEASQHLTCLADALDARRGEVEAQKKLAGVMSATSCGLLRADLVADASRLDLLDDMLHARNGWSASVDASDRLVASMLMYEVKPDTASYSYDYYPSGALIDPTEILQALPIGLAFSLPIADANAQLDRALFESYLGNHAAAALAVRGALMNAGVGGTWLGSETPTPGDLFAYRPAGSFHQLKEHRRQLYFAAILAARAGETKNARTYLELAPDESHGRALLTPYLDAYDTGRLAPMKATMANDPWWPTQQIWAEIAKNHPTALVDVLRTQRSNGLSVLPFAPPNVIRVSALQQWATRDIAPPCWGCTPFAAIRDLVSRRRIAQAVGAEALERDLASQVERVRTVLLRRDLAVPLYVLTKALLEKEE